MQDVLIIGLGCAGYTAAIYCARYKLSVLLVGQEEGGMGQTAAEVGNWPGDIEVKGPELMERMKKHAMSFDSVTYKVAYVEKIESVPGGFRAIMSGGEAADARSIIFAMGSNKRHLGIPGEERLSGKGVTYCATCDAFFYKGKDVAVIGGGDAAVEGAAIAAQVARNVYLIHRRSEFKAEPYWVDKVKAKENITLVLERNTVEVLGEKKVEAVKLDQPFANSNEIKVDGVFIEVGSTPATDLAKQLGCELDKRGFLSVRANQGTNIAGVFGAGDVTNASNYFAQFATAAGEGAIAANSVFSYLQGNEHAGSMA
ncbi:MAG TPA: FAD-dependent oxidoreductase [Candidatus Peribacterales bacterium]|nr:FAD-dependent oxidoreductase [Candidatus Peribacterales bacterium]